MTDGYTTCKCNVQESRIAMELLGTDPRMDIQQNEECHAKNYVIQGWLLLFAHRASLTTAQYNA